MFYNSVGKETVHIAGNTVITKRAPKQRLHGGNDSDGDGASNGDGDGDSDGDGDGDGEGDTDVTCQ